MKRQDERTPTPFRAAAVRNGRSGGGWTAALAALALLCLPVSPHAAPAAGKARVGSILGTPEQIARDRLAVRLLASAPVQRELRNLEAFYGRDPIADMPDARGSLKAAAAAAAMANAVGAVNQDPDRPAAYWSITAEHRWGKLRVPLAGAERDNPDNVYRSIPIDGAARYEIRGQVTARPPAQETFVLHDVASGVSRDSKVLNHEEELGSVSLDQLALAPDGSFTVTVDNSPANGRLNHLRSRPGDHDGYILIRDTLADWSSENPVRLSVRRVAGPPIRPARSEARMARLAAERLSTIGPYWIAWEHKVFFGAPANTLAGDRPRVSGWGSINGGHFRIADDEALVVRVDRRGAAYLGFQLVDLWGQASPYIDRSGSRTQFQTTPNADGTYTYVVSVRDPGVHNWLDPNGLHAGIFGIRWQRLPSGVSTADAVREIRVVKLGDLKAALPAETVWVTPAQRRAELKARAADYNRRIVN